jgi:UDP-N-acetylglucosamine:LPS N-acetylglucosamine transferase
MLDCQTARRMLRIQFVFFDAGGGHRAAATALDIAISGQQRPWEVRLTNLQELLDKLDILKRYAGIRIEDFYNWMLRSGYTLGSIQLMKVLQAVIWAYHGPTVRMLEAHWKETQPDIVVSFVPHFNRALGESFRRAYPTRPFVTVLTDVADYPPHFWIERQEQYFICGTTKAVEQALALGHPKERIFQTSGMILRPKFYEPLNIDREEGRDQLGLEPEMPTGLVLFGGEGSGVMLEIAKRMTTKAQFIFICGKNQKLAERLRRLPTTFPKYIEGFTSEIPYYMHLSDFFIGKPGPGSISEALAMHLPVVVERNAWTLPQERYNTEWIREKDVGVVLKNFREIESGVRTLLEPANFARFRANAAAITNRAVFEIPDMLDAILQQKSPSAR